VCSYIANYLGLLPGAESLPVRAAGSKTLLFDAVRLVVQIGLGDAIDKPKDGSLNLFDPDAEPLLLDAPFGNDRTRARSASAVIHSPTPALLPPTASNGRISGELSPVELFLGPSSTNGVLVDDALVEVSKPETNTPSSSRPMTLAPPPPAAIITTTSSSPSTLHDWITTTADKVLV